MSGTRSSRPLVFRVAQGVLSVESRDGCVYVVAPVGESQGPVSHFDHQARRAWRAPGIQGELAISDAIATHREAIARLYVGFELKLPPADCDEPTRSLLVRMLAGGLLISAFPRDTQAN